MRLPPRYTHSAHYLSARFFTSFSLLSCKTPISVGASGFSLCAALLRRPFSWPLAISVIFKPPTKKKEGEGCSHVKDLCISGTQKALMIVIKSLLHHYKKGNRSQPKMGPGRCIVRVCVIINVTHFLRTAHDHPIH